MAHSGCLLYTSTPHCAVFYLRLCWILLLRSAKVDFCMAGFISCCAEAAQEAYNDVEKRRRKSPKMFDHHNEEASLNEDRKVTEMVQPGSGTGFGHVRLRAGIFRQEFGRTQGQGCRQDVYTRQVLT